MPLKRLICKAKNTVKIAPGAQLQAVQNAA